LESPEIPPIGVRLSHQDRFKLSSTEQKQHPPRMVFPNGPSIPILAWNRSFVKALKKKGRKKVLKILEKFYPQPFTKKVFRAKMEPKGNGIEAVF